MKKILYIYLSYCEPIIDVLIKLITNHFLYCKREIVKTRSTNFPESNLLRNAIN